VATASLDRLLDYRAVELHHLDTPGTGCIATWNAVENAAADDFDGGRVIGAELDVGPLGAAKDGEPRDRTA